MNSRTQKSLIGNADMWSQTCQQMHQDYFAAMQSNQDASGSLCMLVVFHKKVFII